VVEKMPIAKRWSKFTLHNLYHVPNVFGVYELADYNEVIYIGSGKLRDRLKHWKSSSDPCIRKSRKYRYEEIYSDERCRQRERALLAKFRRRHGRLPKCNERLG
jgi:hypothetical protein